MGPVSGVSNFNENRTCLATQKQDQETRGEGEIEISGALSIRPLRIVRRIYCRTRHGVSSENASSTNFACSHYVDHPVSLTAVEAPTEEEALWLFAPPD